MTNTKDLVFQDVPLEVFRLIPLKSSTWHSLLSSLELLLPPFCRQLPSSHRQLSFCKAICIFHLYTYYFLDTLCNGLHFYKPFEEIMQSYYETCQAADIRIFYKGNTLRLFYVTVWQMNCKIKHHQWYKEIILLIVALRRKWYPVMKFYYKKLSSCMHMETDFSLWSMATDLNSSREDS